MFGKQRFWLQLLSGALLIVAAFAGGWLAYAHSHKATRKSGIHIGARYLIPSEFAYVPLAATSQTAGFSAGDRVDVMVVIDSEPEPLILDALVARNTKRSFSLLVRAEEVSPLAYVHQKEMELVYRPSIVPSEAEYISDFHEAQIEREKRRAEGKVSF